MLNRIRTSGYWITKWRAAVKSILAKCITCKKINNLTFEYPKPNDYYGDKVNYIKPFYDTGINFTGHFNLKLGDKIKKMFILVFTCLNVRAVNGYVMRAIFVSVLRFINLHSIPDKVYSDNASKIGIVLALFRLE